MSYRYPSKIFCCFAFTLFCKIASGQSAADSAAYDASVSNVVNRFYQGIAEQSRLYSGFIYDSYDSSITGSAYLDDIDNWRAGTVDYDGQTFDNVSMVYDLYTDKLVVLPYNHSSPLSLVSEKVKSFDLHSRHFVRVANSNSGIKAGFYEQLYAGTSEVLKKVEKTLKSTSGSGGRQRYFVLVHETPDYYIKKNGTYYAVSSQSSVLDLFPDRKKELRQYIKTNRLQFKDFFEMALKTVATYYDSLTK